MHFHAGHGAILEVRFDFHPAQYVRQLVAGYSKNTAQGGLRVYMPDYNEVNGMKPR